jgi:hypothetical protein
MKSHFTGNRKSIKCTASHTLIQTTTAAAASLAGALSSSGATHEIPFHWQQDINQMYC